MFFNSYIFILLFFPLVLIGYFGLNKYGKEKAARGYLIMMSLWFAGFHSIGSVGVLLGSILGNYGIRTVMYRTEDKKKKKVFLTLGITANIVVLFCFKYFNFFVENVNKITGAQLSYWELALPLGISFYTFGQVAYLVDSYRGECPEASFAEYMAYVSFFPKLIQGPIVRPGEIFSQFQNKEAKRPDYGNLCKGLYAFALGLAKKVLLADSLAKIVNVGYNSIESLNLVDAMLVMVCYSLQIYFDFSGYCDMAYGIGYALNIKLPINFQSPYKATSVSDFWDRWHMTLTGFFTRYVYIPLGGSRKGKARTLLNIMIVFLISGLWHGANWTFVLWGALHGFLKVFERVTNAENWKLPKPVKQIATFGVTTLAWSIFRAASLTEVISLWKRIFVGGIGRISAPICECFNELLEMKILYRLGLGGIIENSPGLILCIFVIALVIACLVMKNTKEKVESFSFTNRKMLVVTVLMLWSILSLSEISEFLYVNF